MLKELEDLLRLREQAVELGPHKLIVRECPIAADLTAAGDELPVDASPEVVKAAKDARAQEMSWRLLVRCTFGEDGQLVFTDADIPTLKASSKWKLAPLVAAINSVNGFDREAEAKNSSAAQV